MPVSSALSDCLWRIDVPGGIEWVAALEAADAVLIRDRAEGLHFCTLRDGGQRRTSEAKPGLTLAAHDGDLALVLDRYRVQLLNLSHGKPPARWSRGEWPAAGGEDDDPEFTTSYVAAALTRGAAYVLRSDGRLGRLSLADGRTVWMRPIGALSDVQMRSIDGERILLTGRRAGKALAFYWSDADAPEAIAARSLPGAPLWTGAADTSVFSVSFEALTVLGPAAPRAVGLPAGFRPLACGIALAEGAPRELRLVLAGRGGALLCIDPRAGSIRWHHRESPADQGDVAPFVTIERDVVLCWRGGVCLALALTDGRELARVSGAGECRGAVVLGGWLQSVFARPVGEARVAISVLAAPLAVPPDSAGRSAPPASAPAVRAERHLGSFAPPREIICTSARLLIVENSGVQAFAWPPTETGP